ncbi:MAG: hypothetical protein ACTII7_10220 [Galactobacter sp.]
MSTPSPYFPEQQPHLPTTPAQEQSWPAQPLPQPSSQDPKKSKFGTRDLTFGLIGLVVGAGVMGGIWGITSSHGADSSTNKTSAVDSAQERLAAAVEECGITTGDFASIEEDSVTLDAVGKYDFTADGITYDDVTCLFEKTGARDSMMDKIGQTRALDGRQEDAWGGFKASWTYHPDDGLNLVIEIQDAPVG